MENSASVHLEYQNPYENYYWIMEEAVEEESSSEESDGEDKPMEDEAHHRYQLIWVILLEICNPFVRFQ